MESRPNSSTGLPDNIAALLCYAFGFISGAVFLALEKDSRFVRFHALQSLVVFMALFVASLGASFIPLIGWIFAIILSPLQLILWVVLMYKGFSGERYKLPIAGDIADSLLAKHFPPAA